MKVQVPKVPPPQREWVTHQGGRPSPSCWQSPGQGLGVKGEGGEEREGGGSPREWEGGREVTARPAAGGALDSSEQAGLKALPGGRAAAAGRQQGTGGGGGWPQLRLQGGRGGRGAGRREVFKCKHPHWRKAASQAPEGHVLGDAYGDGSPEKGQAWVSGGLGTPSCLLLFSKPRECSWEWTDLGGESCSSKKARSQTPGGTYYYIKKRN